jgi:hypothetical protein
MMFCLTCSFSYGWSFKIFCFGANLKNRLFLSSLRVKMSFLKRFSVVDPDPDCPADTDPDPYPFQFNRCEAKLYIFSKFNILFQLLKNYDTYDVDE